MYVRGNNLHDLEVARDSGQLYCGHFTKITASSFDELFSIQNHEVETETTWGT